MSKTIIIKEYENLGESTILTQDSKYPAVIRVTSTKTYNGIKEEKEIGLITFYEIEQYIKNR